MIYVQFISDFTCPFCYVARAAFLEAAKDFEVEIDFLPYEATPPGQSRPDTCHDQQKRREYRLYLAKRCRELGLSAKLPPGVSPRPYTRLATEGRYFAEDHGRGIAYSQRVLDAYYLEEQDIGDPEVLTRLADEVGLDSSSFRAALERGDYTAVVEQLERDIVEEVQPKRIPTILIGEQIRLDGGAYSVERYRKLLQAAQEEQLQLALDGAGCGDYGCGI